MNSVRPGLCNVHKHASRVSQNSQVRGQAFSLGSKQLFNAAIVNFVFSSRNVNKNAFFFYKGYRVLPVQHTNRTTLQI